MHRLICFPTIRLIAVILVALACSGLGLGGEIHDAARNDNLVKVKALLKENPDLVFSKDSDGMTALHWASARGHKDIMELLLASNADVNAKDSAEWTPLHWASAEGRKDVMEILREHGGYSNVGSRGTKEAVQEAQQQLQALGYAPGLADGAMGSRTMAALRKFQSDRGLPVTGKLDQKTAAVLAAQKASHDVAAGPQASRPVAKESTVPVLGGQVVHLDHPLHDGDTLAAMGGNNGIQIVGGAGVRANRVSEVHETADAGDLETLRLLLKRKPDLVFGRDESGQTPLHIAAYNGDRNMVELLLASKANVNAQDNARSTPLLWAVAHSGRAGVVELLLAAKADVNADNVMRETPLSEAAELHHMIDVAELLVEYKADVNKRGLRGDTPLYIAVQNFNTDVAELLLASNADVNATSDTGMTALHEAAFGGEKAFAELLLAHGANVNAETTQGATPLDVAVRFGRTAVAELLRQHGGQSHRQ